MLHWFFKFEANYLTTLPLHRLALTGKTWPIMTARVAAC